jgi:hypothetical protein
MLKRFEIVAHLQTWDVRHNQVSFQTCRRKRDAIRLALALGHLQQRMGDEAEIILRDRSGGAQATRRFPLSGLSRR